MQIDERAEARARRRERFASITMAERRERHDAVAATKADGLGARRALADAFLTSHPGGIVVEPDRAVAVADLVSETADARGEAASLAVGRAAEVDNGALEFPVLGHELAADGPALRLATSPLVLAPVIRYFGMVPILFNAFVTRAHTTTFLADTAHRFHLDPEDVCSFKVFVHLSDVDEGCGPFHVLPADRSAQVLAAVDYRGIDYIDDDRVRDLVGWDAVVAVLGPAGTVAFADTTRCLHFGGRPRSAGKPVREMLVFQYLLPTSILLTGDGAVEPRRFLSQLEPSGDATWDALIGHVYT